jgi:signal transduction histidine kinase
MTVASVAAGWLLAGRVLRPLRTITSTTQQISEDNLHQRLALSGPRDELKDLGDTIDALLARLDAAFAAQRNFVANASHELRTPLALSRVMLQVALADPGITLDSLRLACEEAIETGRQQEQLIEALLTLARSQRGLEDRKPVDLAAVVTEAARAHEAGAAAKGVHVDLSIAPALVSGDTELVERLVSNLIDNALRYNVSGANVRVLVDTDSDHVRFNVTNTGPQVPLACD